MVWREVVWYSGGKVGSIGMEGGRWGGGSGKEEAMVELYGEHVRENFTTVC